MKKKKALTGPPLHLLHQAPQSQRGRAGASGEEAQSPAPGVTVDGAVPRFPEGGRARQSVHEGKSRTRREPNGKKRSENLMEAMFPFADLVRLRAGRPLRSPGPGEGSEGAAETQPAASQTVSGTRNASCHDHLSGRTID